MGKKLVLKAPEISEKQFDVILLIAGVAVIGYALYAAGVFNGPGKVIDATDRFAGKSNGAGNGTESPEGTK